MDNPFFMALGGGNFDPATLARQSNDVLLPFRHYLDNSIKALENKEVSCEWRPLTNKRYRLMPVQKIWRVTPASEIEILDDRAGWFEILAEAEGVPLDVSFAPELTDPVIVGKGAERQRYKLESQHFRKNKNRFEVYLPQVDQAVRIQWSGYQLDIRPLAALLSGVEHVHVDGYSCRVMYQLGSRLVLEGYVTDKSAISSNGRDVAFQLISSLDESSLATSPVRSEGNGWLFVSKDRPSVSPHKIEDVTDKHLADMSADYLLCGGVALSAAQWRVTAEKAALIIEPTSGAQLKKIDFVYCSSIAGLEFSVESKVVEEKWIQLIEKSNTGDDTGKSDLDYFFEDNQNIKILDLTQNKRDEGFRVLKSRPEERQILLAPNKREKKSRGSVYPASRGEQCEIRVSVDLTQLTRQKNAVTNLMSRPAAEHWPLIQLLQHRPQTHWPDTVPVPEQEIVWRVLTDPNFAGCDRQREFVSKALATPDFAILDGPPGTGKTTTILELITQLLLDGKRVLLTASTHAAINNVLERIKEDNGLSKHIFPLRIGYENNATGVEDYHFDNVLEMLQRDSGFDLITKQLMVDASNLVCGTTLGILRLFNDKDVSLDRGEPPFDVMIIDECSKTTFQEFLVPARFARRWVLVGDVRQLSPFTDREQIVANLDNLMLRPAKGKKPAETLPEPVQRACFLLEELRGDDRDPYQQPMLVPVSRGTLQALREELQARRADKQLNQGIDNILLIHAEAGMSTGSDWNTDIDAAVQEPWRLYSASLCFVDEAAMTILQPMIPDDMLILHSDWQRSQQAFLHKSVGIATRPFKTNKRGTITATSAIHEELLSRLDSTKWSEEVCWRLEREYWLRLSNNFQRKTGYLTGTLNRLFPKSVDADGRIHILKDIAFPSILEALSGSGLKQRKKDIPTTLNQGFTDNEKSQRYTTLTFQHRMHPDISAFPRKQFYPPGVLKDGSQTVVNREWTYDRFKTRSAWVDVVGDTYKNVNSKEIKAVMDELKIFCYWAETETKNADGESFDVAILTFYKGQEKALREALQKLTGTHQSYARFAYKGTNIKLATVDYFQGQEADVVLLSMVNTERDGFMDSPNRLNVAITRARYQLVVVGHYEYFSQRSKTDELKSLAKSCLRNVGPVVDKPRHVSKKWD